MCINWRLNRPISERERAHMCKYQYVYGLTERLGASIPPVFDTVSSSCSHNSILDRPVLSIVQDILAQERYALFFLSKRVAQKIWKSMCA